MQVYCLVYLPDSNSQLPYVYFQLDGVSTPSPWIPHPSDNGTVVVCFQSPNLSTGEHTLAIELANDGPFYLDGLGVQLPAGLQTQTGGGPTLAATSPPTVQTVYVNHLSGSKAPVGPIVGGVVGGVALIAGALLALWFICMRRKNGRPYYYNAAAAHDMLAQGIALSSVEAFSILTAMICRGEGCCIRHAVSSLRTNSVSLLRLCGSSHCPTIRLWRLEYRPLRTKFCRWIKRRSRPRCRNRLAVLCRAKPCTHAFRGELSVGVEYGGFNAGAEKGHGGGSTDHPGEQRGAACRFRRSVQPLRRGIRLSNTR